MQDSITLNASEQKFSIASCEACERSSAVWQNLKSVLGHFGMEENTDYTMAELQRQPALGDYRSAAEIPLQAVACSRDYSPCSRRDREPKATLARPNPDHEVCREGENMYEWQSGTGAFTSPYRFNAKELDPETGLHYYGARYYANRTGIWLSVDPLASKYPNLTPYNYVDNNPIVYIDPNGKFKISARFASAYPLISKYLNEKLLNDVKNSGIILSALRLYGAKNEDGTTYFTDSQVERIFGENSGPVLFAKPGAGTKLGANGRTMPNGDVVIATELLDRVKSVLNDPDATSEKKQAALLEVFMTITHEAIHVSEMDLYGGMPDGAEWGNVFESDAFGAGNTDILRDGDESNDHLFNYTLNGRYYEYKRGEISPEEFRKTLLEAGKSEVLPSLPDE